MPSYMDYPFQVNSLGRTTIIGRDNHVRDMIEQVLFTSPGERVNRPDFGCGLLQAVFGMTNDATLATLQHSVHGALQRWLGDIIEVQEVAVNKRDSQLHVTVRYVRLDNGEMLTDIFGTG